MLSPGARLDSGDYVNTDGQRHDMRFLYSRRELIGSCLVHSCSVADVQAVSPACADL